MGGVALVAGVGAAGAHTCGQVGVQLALDAGPSIITGEAVSATGHAGPPRNVETPHALQAGDTAGAAEAVGGTSLACAGAVGIVAHLALYACTAGLAQQAVVHAGAGSAAVARNIVPDVALLANARSIADRKSVV